MADLRQETEEWLKQGEGLRTRLLVRKGEIAKQKAELTREEGELDARLKLIPVPPPTPGQKLMADLGKAVIEIGHAWAVQQTLPAIIRALLMSVPGREMSSKDLVEHIHKARPDLENTRIHSELFRMKERKQLGAKGERPHTVYFLPAKEAPP
jgi:hypothetical protein